jgi:hypothetical protein
MPGAYEYAKDKFWKAVGGMHYGEDSDFHPFFLHGLRHFPHEFRHLTSL